MRNANRLGLLPQLALGCLLVLGIARCSLGHSGQRVGASAISHLNGTPILFADLDGDRIPDLAQVELQSQRSARTNYSIHLKLSAGVESAIGVSGPDGGLRVSARDVNGDDSLDLIVTSNLDATFIRVLLNDGHGNFTMAEPGDFQWLEKEGGVVLHGPAVTQGDRATLASARSLHEDILVTGRDADRGFSAQSFCLRDVSPAVRRAVLCPFGRSPPEVALS